MSTASPGLSPLLPAGSVLPSGEPHQGRWCVAPTQGRAEAVASSGDQITKASSSTATATRRFAGSSTASS
jgi:hypothetical protein